MWVDAHCHIQPDYSRGQEAKALIERARAAGIDWMVCVGTDLASSLAAIALADEFEDVYATVGLHPHDASKLDDEWLALVSAADHENVVGIGEAGFDLFYEHSPFDQQRVTFARHIALANALDRALVIHSRDAWDATFELLAELGVPRRTVFHCFSGGPREARRALEMGCYLSFSGIVSFKTADELRAAAAITPSDRLLIETDSPFLAPVPFRGRDNEPAYVAVVGEAVALARGESVEQIAAVTTANAEQVFGVSHR